MIWFSLLRFFRWMDLKLEIRWNFTGSYAILLFIFMIEFYVSTFVPVNFTIGSRSECLAKIMISNDLCILKRATTLQQYLIRLTLWFAHPPSLYCCLKPKCRCFYNILFILLFFDCDEKNKTNINKIILQNIIKTIFEDFQCSNLNWI